VGRRHRGLPHHNPSTRIGTSNSATAQAALTLSGLQRVRCRARQAPGHTRGRVLKIDRAIHAALGHLLRNDGAKPTPPRRRYGRAIALRPGHREGLSLGPPADIDTTRIRRERPVFPGVGGELMECQSDGLRCSRLQAQFGALRGDTGTNEIGEVRELGANQVLGLDPLHSPRTSSS
jgi:hypothetical protein